MRLLRLEAAYTIYKGSGGGGHAEEEEDGEQRGDQLPVMVLAGGVSWLHLCVGLCW